MQAVWISSKVKNLSLEEQDDRKLQTNALGIAETRNCYKGNNF
jgi:hypothetical protein